MLNINIVKIVCVNKYLSYT